jgi:ribonuclease P protein component
VRRVFREGRAVPGDRVVLFVAPGRGEVATVAGSKIGGAVERNRARRVLRAALRETAPEGLADRDLVVVARSSIRGATSPQLAEELRGLLERARSRS